MSEHYKSSSYPSVDIILFDEFISRDGYLPNEFVTFMNVLSTIIRHRDDVIIYMLGNTVNRYCVYFTEMNLQGVPKQAQGTIDVYKYVNNPELTVAVEYCGEGERQILRLRKPEAEYDNNGRMGDCELSPYTVRVHSARSEVFLLHSVQ